MVEETKHTTKGKKTIAENTNTETKLPMQNIVPPQLDVDDS